MNKNKYKGLLGILTKAGSVQQKQQWYRRRASSPLGITPWYLPVVLETSLQNQDSRNSSQGKTKERL
jgi:hypothetical protein